MAGSSTFALFSKVYASAFVSKVTTGQPGVLSPPILTHSFSLIPRGGSGSPTSRETTMHRRFLPSIEMIFAFVPGKSEK